MRCRRAAQGWELRRTGVLLGPWCLLVGSAIRATEPGPSPPLLSVAGTYATAVTLIADSCTGTMVHDNPTVVQQQPGDTIVRLTHAAIAASGSVHDDGRFHMTPVVVPIAGVNYHVDIDGRFAMRGFAATVHVGVGDLGQPRRCGYTVRWIGDKQGAPNVIPGRRR